MKLAKDYTSRSSARRHKVTVTRPASSNENGFVSNETEIICTVWASIQAVSEKMRHLYSTQSVQATHNIIVAGTTDVLEKDIIVFRDRKFEVLTIKDVDEIGRDKVIITIEIRPK